MKLQQNEIKKIAIFRALQLGDILCAIPAIRELKRAYPQAEIILLGLPWAASLTARFPKYIDRFIHFPGYPGLPEQPFDAKSFLAFLQKVQEEEFDLILQMQGNGSIVNHMIELFWAKHLAGFCLPGSYCNNTELFMDYPEGLHETQRHLKLMEYLGIPVEDAGMEFPLYEEDLDEFKSMKNEMPTGAYICVHPGSRGSWRQWPPAYFAKLADLAADKGYQVVITGTNDELTIVNEVAEAMQHRPFIAAGKTSVGAVATLIKNSALLISNCTGVSHIAAALKTPSVVISMDGEPERWAPLNTTLHRTIDWTKYPDYMLAEAALNDLIGSLLQRSKLRNETRVAG